MTIITFNMARWYRLRKTIQIASVADGDDALIVMAKIDKKERDRTLFIWTLGRLSK